MFTTSSGWFAGVTEPGLNGTKEHPAFDGSLAGTENGSLAVTEDQGLAGLETPSVSRLQPTFTLPLYSLIGSLGIVGNGFVIYIIWRSRHMRSKLPNWFIANQSCLDLMSSVILIASESSKWQTYRYTGVAYDVYCRLWKSDYFLWSMLMSSTYNLLAVTVERYLEIVHPLWHKKSFTENTAVAMIVAVWLVGPFYNTFNFAATATSGGRCLILRFWPSDTFRRAFGIVTLVVQFFFPMLAMTYSYVRMVLALRQHSAELAGGGQQQTHLRLRMRARKNLIKTLCVVLLCFVVCWGWNEVYFLLGNFGMKIDFKGAFYKFSVVMVNVNCCVNPFVYAFKYRDFQKECRLLLCRGPTQVAPTNMATNTGGSLNAHASSARHPIQTVASTSRMECA